MLIYAAIALALVFTAIVFRQLRFERIVRAALLDSVSRGDERVTAPRSILDAVAAREAKVRAIIQTEAARLDRYERGHTERQQTRTAKGKGHKSVRPHGEYDPDQRRAHIEIVVRQQMKNPPANLAEIIREEVGADEE